MTPDPTPVVGIVSPIESVLVPSTVMRTTAGVTFAATSMIADDSSSVTGCFAPTVVPVVVAAGIGVWRSSAPDAFNARNVPPEPRTPARIAARMTCPSGDERVPRGATATVSGRAVGCDQATRSLGVGSDHDELGRDQSARGSGVGE